MTDKEKGKSNPFVGVLHDDEEILWFYKRLPLTFGAHLKDYVIKGFVFVFVVSIGMWLFLSLVDAGQNWTPIQWLMTILFSISIPVLLLTYPLEWISNIRVDEAYTVTNHRLLHYKHYRVLDRKLEHIYTVSSHNRTISFHSPGLSFPPWRDIEDASDVVQIIEQARLKAFAESEQDA